MGLRIEQIALLLFVAALVAMVARRLQLPYTVGLVFAGTALALSPVSAQIPLTRNLIFTAFLPPLIFEAAFYTPWRELRRDLPVLFTLATVGVLLSAALTATGMRFLIGWPWPAALLFGALIAATDPVSVIATFREAAVHGRLRILVEAESLLNDGTAAVAFSVALAATTGATVAPGSIALAPGDILLALLTKVLGGILCGALVGALLLLLAWRTTDHLVEIMFTTIAAYGSFLLAEYFHLSGVLATMTAGVLVGSVGPLGALSEKGREAVGSFWEYLTFVVNSLIFLLIGIQIAHERFLTVLVASMAAIFLVLLGRAVAVYPCCALFIRSPLRVDIRHQHVLFWGGLRGALALALSLGIPPAFPHSEAIRTVAFAVAAFSIIVQGLTMKPLLRKMGLLDTSNGQSPGH